MKITIGFSPCPNDTFIFDALVNNKIDTRGFDFEVMLEDVQTLNEWAIQSRLDVSKISYGALPLFLNNYIVLSSGGALGKGVGPLLIAAKEIETSEVNEATIAIPGINTTAHLLFSLAYPEAKNKIFLKFNGIENFVLDHADGNPVGAYGNPDYANTNPDDADANRDSANTIAGKNYLGVIIHENRFTYQQKGLTKIIDLGEFWEKETGYPIPLGGIVMKRTFDPETQHTINDLIRESIEYAYAHGPELAPYVKQHSQEMAESVMRQHIDLYVNNYSIDLGPDGKNAVKKFLEIYGSLSYADTESLSNQQGKKPIFIESRNPITP